MRFAREQGTGRIWLHAMAEGRPLYESAGFQPNPTARMNPTSLQIFPK